MNIREQLHKVRYGPICNFDSESSSDNSQKVVNETQDMRIAAATDSTNLSLNRSSVGDVRIVTTDHGAVDSAFHFANDMAKGTINANTHALDTVAGMSQSNAASLAKISGNAIDAVSSAYQDNTAMVAKAYANDNAVMADAYKTAKAGEQKILVGAVVGLVALAAIKMGAGK